MKKYFSKMLLLCLALSVVVVGCKDKDDDPAGSTEAKLLTFKVINAGVEMNITADGTINEADKTVEVRVPFETDLTKLKFVATASEGAKVVPDGATELDFSLVKDIIVVNGMTNNTYKVSVLKQDPTTPTVTKIKLVNTSGTVYATRIDYKNSKILIDILSGYTTVVKAEEIEVGPQGATYVIANANTEQYFDVSQSSTKITVMSGTSKKDFTFEVIGVPVGADFEKPAVVALTSLSGEFPSVLGGSNNRDAHMANGIVYVPTRQSGNHVYYWEVAKLFAGNKTPSELKTVGMDFAGTTWNVSSVYAVGEKIYVASMANAKDAKLKVWYWANKDADPSLILDYAIPAPTAPSKAVRLGDCFSVVTDASGNGKMFFSNLPFQNINNQFYVFNVSGHKTINAVPAIWNLDLGGINVGQYGRVNGIPGQTKKYMVKGAEMGLATVDDDGKVLHTVSTDAIQGRAQDPCIVSFNDARYLVYTVNREWEKGDVFSEILNISEGETASDALKLITAVTYPTKQMLKFNIMKKDVADAWVSACAGAEVINDELYVMSFSTLSGFAVQKFAKNASK